MSESMYDIVCCIGFVFIYLGALIIAEIIISNIIGMGSDVDENLFLANVLQFVVVAYFICRKVYSW